VNIRIYSCKFTYPVEGQEAIRNKKTPSPDSTLNGILKQLSKRGTTSVTKAFNAVFGMYYLQPASRRRSGKEHWTRLPVQWPYLVHHFSATLTDVFRDFCEI
jgi:hypothetical protein